MKILAIDLGGTSAKIALFHDSKEIKRWQINTDLNDVFGNIKKGLSDLNSDDFEYVGLAVPGFLDHKTGVVALSGNMKWKDFDVQEDFEKHFPGKKIFVLNDANAAALGEFWKGAGQKFGSIVFYTIGTGVGGGIVIEGELISGYKGYAGELGHGGNFQNKYKCTCGLDHCVEPLSSATGITRLLKEYGYDISVKDAAQKWLKEGETKIRDIFKEALTPLGKHIAVMQTAINPEAIIIGGGPSAIGEPLRELIEEIVSENQLGFIAESTAIEIATTMNDAGIYGAAYWAMRNSKKRA